MQLAFVECRDQQIASNSGFGEIGFLDKFSEILRIAKFKFVCGWEFCECQPQTKHVERLLFHFSDVGSTPTASTKKTRLGLFLWRGSCCAPAQANFVCNPRDVAGARRCLLVSGVKLSLDCIQLLCTKELISVFLRRWKSWCYSLGNSWWFFVSNISFFHIMYWIKPLRKEIFLWHAVEDNVVVNQLKQ